MLYIIASTLVLCSAPMTPSGEIDNRRAEMTFIGFSSDELLAAWRIDVEERRPELRVVDGYSLVRVVGSVTGSRVGTYRASEIRRVDLRGRKVKTPDIALAEANATWAEALSQEDWRAFDSQMQFRSFQLLAANSFSVVPDRDCDIEIEHFDWDIRADKTSSIARTIRIVSRAPGSLGYTISAGIDSALHVGHFRFDANDGETVRAWVDIVQSASGRYLAVTNRFEAARGKAQRIEMQAKIVRLSNVEIAAMSIADQDFQVLRRRRVAVEQERLKLIDELVRMADDMNKNATLFPDLEQAVPAGR